MDLVLLILRNCTVQSIAKAKSRKVVTLRTYGGDGGSPWDDGAHNGIKKIIIVHADAIDSIRFQYAKFYGSAWGEKHGGNGGHRTDTIELNYPDEKIVCISGHYGSIAGGKPVIRSLTFHTNMRKFGPYGVEQGTNFTISVSESKIVGFHGRGGWFLDSIGVHAVSTADNTTWQSFKDGCSNYIQKISN